MSIQIEDGTGSGKRAGVSVDNRLYTESVSRSRMAEVSEEDGQAYLFTTAGFITFTGAAADDAVLHIKNTSATRHMHIHRIRTCGDVINKWQAYTGSTGGTLITDQTAGGSRNMNLTSGNVAEATVYKGAEGKTITGGTFLTQWENNVGHGHENFEGALIIGVNSSIELTVDVSGAGDICVEVVAYYEPNED